MTPEETILRALEQWWMDKPVPTKGISWMQQAWMEAWRQGHHQGMTRAAEICDELIDHYDHHAGYKPGPLQHASKIILAERDKGKK